MDAAGKGLPLEDWSCLKTGIAGVLGERSGREARGAGGSLRNWRQPEAARRILPNTGVGCVQGKGRGDTGWAGHTPRWLGEKLGITLKNSQLIAFISSYIFLDTF